MELPMAGELLQKINKLRDIIIEKNNAEFGRNAVEILNPEKVDEDIISGGEEHTEVGNPEINMEAEYISIEKELRESIAEESAATAQYLNRAKKALKHGDHSLYVLYKELAADEMIHMAQLQATLEILGMTNKAAEVKGRLEAMEILHAGGISEAKEDENTKRQRKLREKADKVAKDFDFVAEYSRGRLEQARQKVVNAINDLIVGKEDLEGTLEKINKDAKKIVKTKKTPKKDKKESTKD